MQQNEPEVACLTRKKLLNCRKEGFGMVALGGVGVYPAQYLLGKVHVSRVQQDLYCWIETLERSRDDISIRLRHLVVEDDSRDPMTSK
jgi:hypothetical protein